LTGVAVPSYYNPAAVNPLKYAEQLKKRKMLWSKAGKETADKEKEVCVDSCQTVARLLTLSVNFNIAFVNLMSVLVTDDR